MIYKVDFAGKTVRYRLRDPAVRIEFGRYMEPSEGTDCDVYATDERMERMRPYMPPGISDYYVEFRALMGETSLELIKHGRCLFHAASFLYRGRAWLLTGPSGIGKTTQFRNWQRLFPGETQIICGDMPVLETCEDGTVRVHSSPWNGKERFGEPGVSGRLACIVRLVQSDEDEFLPLSPADAVMPLFSQFAVRPETGRQIELLAGFADKVLSAVPCVVYNNRGDDGSTLKLREMFNGILERE